METKASSMRTAADRGWLEGQAQLGPAFTLTHGEQLSEPMLDYAVAGPDEAPVAVVLGGISADRHPWRWWKGVVGPGLPIDLREYRVLGIDWLGSRIDAPSANGSTMWGSYPLISTRDQARALICVLDELGIETVHALIGSSYGGMVGLATAASYPGRIRRLVVISGAHRTHPMATAHRAVQRGIIQLSHAAGSQDDGVALARALAMTTYRTVGEFEQRFDARPGPAGTFEVEEYLVARGRDFSRRFGPRSFAALSHSIDLHWVDPADVHVPVDLVSMESDQLVPTWLMDELAEQLAGPRRHHRLQSEWGHDGFLKEDAKIGALVRDVLRGEQVPDALHPLVTVDVHGKGSPVHG